MDPSASAGPAQVELTILGHLAVLDSQPLPEDPRIVTIFEVFAERAAAEIRRMRADEEIRSREEQLASLINSAMDAVLVIDERHRIVRTNPATARILGADENGLAAQPLERFLDRESRTLLDGRISEMSRQPVHERRYWFPRGLLGLDDRVSPGYEQIRVKMDVKADCPDEELEALLAYTQEHSPVCNTVCRPVPVLVERARADVRPPSPTPQI